MTVVGQEEDEFMGGYDPFASVACCLISIVILIVVGIPLGVLAAIGLVRGNFPGKNLLYAFLFSPMIVPFVITALAMYYFYSSLKLVGHPWALLLSHICLATPIVIVIVSTTLQDFDRSLEQAAQIMGATNTQRPKH